MAGQFAQFAPVAADLLAEFGTSRTLSRDVDGAYDPSAGGSAATPETLTGLGVVLNFSTKEFNGTTVQIGDKKLIYQGDQIQIGDRLGNFRVADAMDLDPDDSGLILQIAMLRK